MTTNNTSLPCFITGCSLDRHHAGEHDFESLPGYGTANDSEIGPEVYPARYDNVEAIDLTDFDWSAVHRQSLLEDSDFILQSARSGRPVPGATLMAARWTFYYAGLRFLIAASLALFLSLPSFAAEPCKVNVNTATPAELQLLARTGEILSSRIVAGRPLDAEKLDAVKGVGEAWLAVNGPHVALAGETTCKEKIKAAPKVAAPSPKL